MNSAYTVLVVVAVTAFFVGYGTSSIIRDIRRIVRARRRVQHLNLPWDKRAVDSLLNTLRERANFSAAAYTPPTKGEPK